MIVLIILSAILILVIALLFLPRLLLKAFPSVEDLYSHAFDFMNVLYDEDPEVSRRKWLNYGLWYKETRTYEEACDNLASRLCDEGGFGPGDKILDVGCGFGTSSFFWHDKVKRETGSSPSITGINISRHHILQANQDKEKWGYGDSVKFNAGDATNLAEYRRQGITKVTALECAFHFRTRQKFFTEVYDVLQPGGKIVLADIIMKKGTPTYLKLKRFIPSFLIRPFFSFLSDVGQVPLENQVELDEYIVQLTNAGFRNIHFEQVMHLASGSVAHYNKKANDVLQGNIPSWLQPWNAEKFKEANRVMNFVNFTFRYADYIIVSAEK
jgi:ubiquinone/menaquinone biosynthesis C-methylase UbiE